MEDFGFISEGDPIHGVLYPVQPGEPSQRAVILCHGAFESCANWLPYAEKLAGNGASVLAIDFVGHGSSGGLRGQVDMRRWAYNLRDAMNALAPRGYRRFALVGWDSGGCAALLAAAHDPRLDCAVILSAPIKLTPLLNERVVFLLMSGWSQVRRLFTRKPLTLSRAGAYLAQRFAVDSQVDEAYRSDEGLQEILGAVPVPGSLDSVWMDITAALEKIKIPVLILHGKNDEVLPLKQSETLFKLLAGEKELVLVEDAGHVLHLDQKKDEVFMAIARWINQRQVN